MSENESECSRAAWGHGEEARVTWALLVFSSCNSSSVSLLGWNLWNPQELISVACGSWLACFVFLGNEDQLDMIYSSPEGQLKSSGSSFMKGIGSKCFVFKFTCYWEFIGKKKKTVERICYQNCVVGPEKMAQWMRALHMKTTGPEFRSWTWLYVLVCLALVGERQAASLDERVNFGFGEKSWIKMSAIIKDTKCFALIFTCADTHICQ